VVNFSFGKIYLKTIIREIRSSIGRFLAVFAIITLGVGFLSGLLVTTPDMELSIDKYFRANNVMDIFIKGTAGLTEYDAKVLKELPEVNDVLGCYVTDAMVQIENDEILVSRIYGLPLENYDSLMNRMELKEGRLPERIDECLVQEGGGSMLFLNPGTTIQIMDTHADDLMPDPYLVKKFTITGIVRSPLFLSMEREPSFVGNGRLGTVIYVHDKCFNMDVYTDIFITLNDTKNLRAFSDPYYDFVKQASKKIEEIGLIHSEFRHRELKYTAEDRITQAEDELHSGRELMRIELTEARRMLDEGWAELSAGERRIRSGEAELNEGFERLALEEEQAEQSYRAADLQITLGAQELTAARRLLQESKVMLDAAADQIESVRSNRALMRTRRVQDGVAQYDRGLAEYNEGLLLVEEKEKELLEGQRALAEGLAAAEREFLKAREDIAAAQTRLTSGRAELTQARLDLNEGEAELLRQQAEGEEKIRQGELDLEEGRRIVKENIIPLPRWYVLDRNSNVGYVNFKMNASKISDISRIFPLFFMLVVALVSLTTMTRMVEEERLQIGVLKALGYKKRVISLKYLVYCGLTGILGSFAGMTLGFRFLPVVVYQAFGTMFHLPPVATEFNWSLGLFTSALIIGSTLIATVAACYKSLYEKPSALLLPRAPKPGKRIFLEYIPFFWKPLKFTYKVSARNLIRHKKHFFMTITGIAGCTALILTGFGLRDSLKDIAQTQYQEILKYDLKIELHKEAKWDAVLENFLTNDSGGNWTAVHTENAYVLYHNERVPVSVITPKPGGNLSDYIALRDRKKKRNIDFNENTAVVTEKLGEAAKLKPGDLMTAEDAHGNRKEIKLTGFTENYVGAYCYLGLEAYRNIFGEPGEYNTLLVRTGVRDLKDQDDVLIKILSSSAVQAAEFTSQIQRSYNNLLFSISFVVILLTGAAGGLAMIVLYNLTNININERSRELATLRVLGFYRNEAAFYIFREITVLSILGTVTGLFIGVPLHGFIISVAENPDLMFGRTISSVSFVISAAVTIGFSILVDFLMLKKINGIKMAESMKAAE